MRGVLLFLFLSVASSAPFRDTHSMTEKRAGPIREAGDSCMYGVGALKCAAGVLISVLGPLLGSLRWSPGFCPYVSTYTHLP